MIKATKQDSERFLLDALWKHERGIDSYSDTNVQSKAREEYRWMQINQI